MSRAADVSILVGDLDDVSGVGTFVDPICFT